MDNNPEIKQMTEALSSAIETNATDNPHLSIDPDTQKPAVLGDPTNIPQIKGDYELKFVYSTDEVSEEEKAKLDYDKQSGLYTAKMKFTNKRIKPLYRGQISILLADILTALGVIEEDGYTSELEAMLVSKELLAKAEAMAELMHLVLGIPQEQAERVSPAGALTFIRQLLMNEPNIIAETSNFLSSSLAS